MGLVASLLSGLAVGALGNLTAPKLPSAAPTPDIDIDEETLRIRKLRQESMDPQLLAAREQVTSTALSLARGDIPQEIEDTLRRVAAENAMTRGLSADQTTRLTARALGQTQLDIMARGQALTASLEQMADTEWSIAADSALGKANQMFEAYALKESQKLAQWTQDSKAHTSFWGGLTQTAATIGYGKKGSETPWLSSLFKDDAKALTIPDRFKLAP